ncbi:MAG: bla regulator protein blaR1 [Gemmatimonadaceae bacterium]|nr:bla regulator protein blaR1 [Gemmatimonadaceae bacterium]
MLSDFIVGHSSLQSVLPVLFDAAIKGAILVIIAAIATYFLRGKSAASRHAVWTAAVIGHLAIPALVLILPARTMPVLPPTQWMESASTTASPISKGGPTSVGEPAPFPEKASAGTPTVAERERPAVNSAPESSPVGTASNARTGLSAIQIFAALWFVGTLLVLLRLAVGTWRVGQLAREGARVEDGVWLSLAQRLANRLGVTRPLILLRGEKLAVPVTWGIVYPAVLLPQDADTWSEERRRFVLVHEMAHVKRFDALTQLLAQLSLAVFWFDPLVWLAAHRMRVEREHACDDYVLRDGTTPSLYAGELLEMVRSIGTPHHDRAAPAFAALAMARRSEFEGRMLAILDPRLDRKSLNRRGTLMTALIVALLTFPLAALRPFQQPTAAIPDALPQSFKVSISEAVPISTQSKYSCDNYVSGSKGTSSHIDSHDSGNGGILEFLISSPARCTEAALVGKAVFSPDETHIAALSAGGFAKFRERTGTFDRAVSVTPVGDGSLSYAALIDGKKAPFDESMQIWLSHLLPEVLREAAINVPARVARLRAQGGVPTVLQAISTTHSPWAKRMHYEELIQNGPALSAADADRVVEQVGRDLTSSGDLSAVLQLLPKTVVRSPVSRRSIAGALSQIKSSGDKSTTLQILAPNADPEMLLLLAKAAEDVQSSGDKANFLITTASEYLTPGNELLRSAYFRTVSTVQSSGDMANVLISAMPYGHGNAPVTLQVVETSRGLASSGDAANVLISLISQRLIQPGNTRATLALIERTMTMASSGDRANVLITLAGSGLLSNTQVKDAYIKAAMALPSEGDRANALAAAARP